MTVRTLGEYDLPWCEWTWVDTELAIKVKTNYHILVGEEYKPSEFKEPHIILLDKSQATEENPYAGDLCYISVDNLVILKGDIEESQLRLIQDWIMKYRAAILEIWNGKHDSVEFLKCIGKIYD